MFSKEAETGWPIDGRREHARHRAKMTDFLPAKENGPEEASSTLSLKVEPPAGRELASVV